MGSGQADGSVDVHGDRSLTSHTVSNSRTGTNLRRCAVQRGFGWQANRSRARWVRFYKRVLERFRERTDPTHCPGG
jgi:hypothetical protein